MLFETGVGNTADPDVEVLFYGFYEVGVFEGHCVVELTGLVCDDEF